MPPKKYQSLDPDSDEEEQQQQQQEQQEQKLLPNEVIRSDEIKTDKTDKLPTRIDGKRVVDKEKLFEAIQNNVITLTNKQQKKIFPKIAPIPTKKKVITDEMREKLKQQLARGRETISKNRLLKKEQKQADKQSVNEKHQKIIEDKMLLIEDNTIRGKKSKSYIKKQQQEQELKQQEQKQQELKKEQQEQKQEMKLPLKNKIKREIEPNNYPSDTETEGDTTDTRSIKRINKKLKMVRKPLQVNHSLPKIEYRDMSILDKLNYRF